MQDGDDEQGGSKAKVRRLHSSDESTMKPQWDNVWDVFFRHHVLTKYGLGQKVRYNHAIFSEHFVVVITYFL